MLTEQQTQIAKDFAEGTLSVNEIASKHEVSRTSLWQYRQNPEFKALMEDFGKQILDMTRNELKLNSNKYLQKLSKLADSKSEKVALDALKTLMGMAGISSEMTTKLELSMPPPVDSGKPSNDVIRKKLESLRATKPDIQQTEEGV